MSKSRKGFTCAVLCFALFTSLAFAKEPKNLELVKNDLIHYHDSGNYMHDIDDVIKHALSYVQLRLEQPHSKKMAIVMDVDETALSNYEDMRTLNFGGTKESQAEIKGNVPAILPTLQFYRYAKSHGIAVVFITGRTEAEREITVSNLLQVGYKDWDGLLMRSKANEKLPAETYKTAMRKQLEDQGYDIILNLGDQKSDLNGGHADKTFKISNPYYSIS